MEEPSYNRIQSSFTNEQTITWKENVKEQFSFRRNCRWCVRQRKCFHALRKLTRSFVRELCKGLKISIIANAQLPKKSHALRVP